MEDEVLIDKVLLTLLEEHIQKRICMICKQACYQGIYEHMIQCINRLNKIVRDRKENMLDHISKFSEYSTHISSNPGLSSLYNSPDPSNINNNLPKLTSPKSIKNNQNSIRDDFLLNPEGPTHYPNKDPFSLINYHPTDFNKNSNNRDKQELSSPPGKIIPSSFHSSDQLPSFSSIYNQSPMSSPRSSFINERTSPPTTSNFNNINSNYINQFNNYNSNNINNLVNNSINSINNNNNNNNNTTTTTTTTPNSGKQVDRVHRAKLYCYLNAFHNDICKAHDTAKSSRCCISYNGNEFYLCRQAHIYGKHSKGVLVESFKMDPKENFKVGNELTQSCKHCSTADNPVPCTDKVSFRNGDMSQSDSVYFCSWSCLLGYFSTNTGKNSKWMEYRVSRGYNNKRGLNDTDYANISNQNSPNIENNNNNNNNNNINNNNISNQNQNKQNNNNTGDENNSQFNKRQKG